MKFSKINSVSNMLTYNILVGDIFARNEHVTHSIVYTEYSIVRENFGSMDTLYT